MLNCMYTPASLFDSENVKQRAVIVLGAFAALHIELAVQMQFYKIASNFYANDAKFLSYG